MGPTVNLFGCRPNAHVEYAFVLVHLYQYKMKVMPLCFVRVFLLYFHAPSSNSRHPTLLFTLCCGFCCHTSSFMCRTVRVKCTNSELGWLLLSVDIPSTRAIGHKPGVLFVRSITIRRFLLHFLHCLPCYV